MVKYFKFGEYLIWRIFTKNSPNVVHAKFCALEVVYIRSKGSTFSIVKNIDSVLKETDCTVLSLLMIIFRHWLNAYFPSAFFR